MKAWLRIAGTPPRQFHRDALALPHLVAGEARHQLLESVGTLLAGVNGETPNLTVTLRNRNGECARLFARPPIHAAAQVLGPDGVLFEGLVARIALGTECQIEVQA